MKTKKKITTDKPVTANRSGFGVTEMIIAMILLGILTSFIVPILSRVGRLHRQIEKQNLLQQTASNLIEQLHTDPVETVTDLKELQKKLEEQLDTTKYRLQVSSPASSQQAGRIQIDLELHPINAGSVLSPVKLSTWFSPIQSEQGDA